MSDGRAHHGLVMDFLRPARGVYPVAKTFHQGWVEGEEFDSWVSSWEQTLKPEELTLWHYMQDQRDWDEHGDGAELVPYAIPIQFDHQHFNGVVLGLDPEAQLKGTKGSVRFGRYRDRPAGEVCAAYLALCQNFVDDYLREPAHVAVIPPPGTAST